MYTFHIKKCIPIIVWNLNLKYPIMFHYKLFSTWKSTSVIKVATMKNICYSKEVIMCYHQIETFVISKDEWNITKEDNGKSTKNALHVL